VQPLPKALHLPTVYLSFDAVTKVEALLSATAFNVAMVLAFGTRFPLAAFLAAVALIDIMVSAF